MTFQGSWKKIIWLLSVKLNHELVLKKKIYIYNEKPWVILYLSDGFNNEPIKETIF